MAIPVKNAAQIRVMRAAGDIVAGAHALLEKAAKPGATTQELADIAEEYIRGRDAAPSFKGYRDFPGSICVSVNEEVIHGIPGPKKLRNGDIVSVDIGAYYQGFHCDAARTLIVGATTPEKEKLVRVTAESFFDSIRYARDGCRLHQISAAVQDYVEPHGFSVVREFIGHGIGRDLHEAPEIPHYRQPSRGPRLARGMTLCVEPMINMGSQEIRVLNDNWTVVTADGQCSAHYENTVLITDGDPELLTMA